MLSAATKTELCWVTSQLPFPEFSWCAIRGRRGKIPEKMTFKYRKSNVDIPIMQISIIQLQSMFSQIQFSDLSHFANVTPRILELFKVKSVSCLSCETPIIDISISHGWLCPIILNIFLALKTWIRADQAKPTKAPGVGLWLEERINLPFILLTQQTLRSFVWQRVKCRTKSQE